MDPWKLFIFVQSFLSIYAEVTVNTAQGVRIRRRIPPKLTHKNGHKQHKTVQNNLHKDKWETKDFLEFLQRKQYDHRARPEPNGPGQPTVVEISIFVGSIRAVSEVTMDYSMEIFYREYWRDPRLARDQTLFKNKSEINLHESYAAYLWRPDTFLPNAVESVNPTEHSITHRSLLRLRTGGKILYSRRLSVTAECPMDLTLFPFDRQVCKLGIESYGYPTTEVHYKWSGSDPVQLGNIKLPDFILEKVLTTARNYTYETGTYSRLYCCFVFARDSGFCFMQLFIPATAVVVCSWVSLWMEKETTFQDMISVILTLTFLIYSYNTVMPRVSYIKAMDVYLGGCFFFVFFSLIKLAIVKYMRQKSEIPRNMSIVCGTTYFDPEVGNGNIPPLDHTPRLAPVRRSFFRPSTGSNLCGLKCMRRCHMFSQILFPLAFVMFCTLYFVCYTTIYAADKHMDC